MIEHIRLIQSLSRTIIIILHDKFRLFAKLPLEIEVDYISITFPDTIYDFSHSISLDPVI